jgi:hypothetical protein
MVPATKQVILNLSGSTSGVTVLTGSVDCKTFGYVSIAVLANSTAAVSTTTAHNALEESDDNSTWVAISSAAPGTGFTPSTVTVASSGPKIIYNVDLRGRKRYLKVTVGLAATATSVGITADLSRASDAPVSATEQGAGYLVQI